MEAGRKQKQQQDMMMNIGGRNIKVMFRPENQIKYLTIIYIKKLHFFWSKLLIKVLPLEQEKALNKEEEVKVGEVEATQLTQRVLKYIEFIGNFVILVFMLTFISIYWCIGNWNSLL